MTDAHHLPLPELYVSADTASALDAEAARLPGWTLDAHQIGELTLLLNGGFAPLRGYMTETDHRAALQGTGSPWPVPLALHVGVELARAISPGDDIALRDPAGDALAVMSVTDSWGPDGACLGGRVKGLRRPAGDQPDTHTPNDLRARFRKGGFPKVLAVLPDHPDEVRAAAECARRLDAVLLILPLSGIVIEAPGGCPSVLSRLPVAPPKGVAGALWQGLVARNHGATHVLLDVDEAARERYRLHQDRIGARMVVPDEML